MLRRIAAWWRLTWADIAELDQRRRLMAEPWREDFLHMGWDGRVHGRLLPPTGYPHLSVTRRGWCVAAMTGSSVRNNADSGEG